MSQEVLRSVSSTILWFSGSCGQDDRTASVQSWNSRYLHVRFFFTPLTLSHYYFLYLSLSDFVHFYIFFCSWFWKKLWLLRFSDFRRIAITFFLHLFLEIHFEILILLCPHPFHAEIFYFLRNCKNKSFKKFFIPHFKVRTAWVVGISTKNEW